MTRLAIRMGFAGLLALATATCPNLATAQNSAAPPKRLGFLSGLGCSTDANPSPMRRRLTELGWVSGRTLIVDCVSTVHPDQADALAAELVARRPDVLAAQPADYVRALKQATATIPIVMVTTPNPVESGLVANLARPEANVTGVVSSGRDVAAKRIGLLKRLLPRLAKLAVIERKGGDADVKAQLEKDVTDAATKLGFTWQAFYPAAPEEYDAIFARLAAEGFDAAYVEPGPLLDANQTRIAGPRCGIGFQPSATTSITLRTAFSSPTVKPQTRLIDVPRNTSTKSCVAPSPLNFRSRGQSSLTSRLI
jgi:putative ABC transport system substrate-binding protein